MEMDTSSRSQFHIKFEIAARTGQSWRLEEEKYPTVMRHYRPKVGKDQRQVGNKFGKGQRPTS
jgi:hypothetical protein